MAISEFEPPTLALVTLPVMSNRTEDGCFMVGTGSAVGLAAAVCANDTDNIKTSRSGKNRDHALRFILPSPFSSWLTFVLQLLKA
jgi:hypothetical protein